MGLDQMAFAEKDGKKVEITYWRKHNRLQGFMEAIWRSKGGQGEFNVIELELTEAEIDLLEFAVINRELPKTHGFFFGADSYQPYQHEANDLTFIKKAKACLADGYKIIYYADY